MKAGNMKGKAALVTGAASGLGKGTALALARAGAHVCLVDVNHGGLDETAAAIRAGGGDVHVQVTDLSKADNCRSAVTVAVQACGRLDALCNVAGIIYFANAHEMAPEQWEKTLAVNLSAPFYLIQAAIPHLLETDGAVVNVASSGGIVGEAYLGAYCASKAGLIHLTRALAMEYAHKSIRFNAVAPGGMMTNIGANLKMPSDVNYDLIKRFSGMRGMVEVDDVADLITFLASDAARAYHGACLSIDKGITAG